MVVGGKYLVLTAYVAKYHIRTLHDINPKSMTHVYITKLATLHAQEELYEGVPTTTKPTKDTRMLK